MGVHHFEIEIIGERKVDIFIFVLFLFLILYRRDVFLFTLLCRFSLNGGDAGTREWRFVVVDSASFGTLSYRRGGPWD